MILKKNSLHNISRLFHHYIVVYHRKILFLWNMWKIQCPSCHKAIHTVKVKKWPKLNFFFFFTGEEITSANPTDTTVNDKSQKLACYWAEAMEKQNYYNFNYENRSVPFHTNFNQTLQ